jgi:hypothetical protein
MILSEEAKKTHVLVMGNMTIRFCLSSSSWCQEAKRSRCSSYQKGLMGPNDPEEINDMAVSYSVLRGEAEDTRSTR